VPYLIAFALMLATLVLGAFIRFPLPRARGSTPAPGLWRVRLLCCVFIVSLFVAAIVLPAPLHLPSPFGLAISAALFGLGVWRVCTWSARPGWAERHWLAVVTGVVLYFAFVWAPFGEFGLRAPDRTGLTVFDVVIVAGLLLWDRRMRRRASGAMAAA
jgi:hypothetical protein